MTKKDNENNLIVLTFRILMSWLPGQDIEMRRDKKKNFQLKTPIGKPFTDNGTPVVHVKNEGLHPISPPFVNYEKYANETDS